MREQFCRIQNLHISQTIFLLVISLTLFCRIQNLHISQTEHDTNLLEFMFCRIQNLHISQTIALPIPALTSFVEFKIYISLKHGK